MFSKTRYCKKCDSVLSAEFRNQFVEEAIKGLFEIILLVGLVALIAFFVLSDWMIVGIIIVTMIAAYFGAIKFLMIYTCSSCGSNYEVKNNKLVLITKDKK